MRLRTIPENPRQQVQVHAVRLTDKQWAEARRLRENKGLADAEIAARFGVRTRTIQARARRERWSRPSARRKTPGRQATFAALTLAARRGLVRRLYKAMDTKLKLMERRMEQQMAELDAPQGALTSADLERDARAFGTIIKNIAQVKEMQADLDRVAGGQPATAADAELFAEADRFRREIAERLARFVPAAE